MRQIVTNRPTSVRHNIQIIRAEGSKATVVLSKEDTCLMATTNSNKFDKQ